MLPMWLSQLCDRHIGDPEKASLQKNAGSSRVATLRYQELDYIVLRQDQDSRWEDLDVWTARSRGGHFPDRTKIWLCYEIDSRSDKDSVSETCGGVKSVDLDVDQVRAVFRRREGEGNWVPGVDVGAGGAE